MSEKESVDLKLSHRQACAVACVLGSLLDEHKMPKGYILAQVENKLLKKGIEKHDYYFDYYKSKAVGLK